MANVWLSTTAVFLTVVCLASADVPKGMALLDGQPVYYSESDGWRLREGDKANWTRFSNSTNTYTCNSSVGMQGGEQLINLGDSCELVGTLHEIGHALAAVRTRKFSMPGPLRVS